MSHQTIDLLFTADDRYAAHIPVVLYSLFENDPGIQCRVHLITEKLNMGTEMRLRALCKRLGYGFFEYRVDEKMFADAPVNKHYSKAMYYRHLAFRILPTEVGKVLYLDPDILIINPLHPLWEIDMEAHLFLAASHTEEQQSLDELNRVRLGTKSPYFNTGVMVMDLDACRREISEEQIFSHIREKSPFLLLPDQDVFNALFGSRTKAVPDEIWNYDARKFTQYLLQSGGKYNEKWVLAHTAVLHFCGKNKPWGKVHPSRFEMLYLHYTEKVNRLALGSFP